MSHKGNFHVQILSGSGPKYRWWTCDLSRHEYSHLPTEPKLRTVLAQDYYPESCWVDLRDSESKQERIFYCYYDEKSWWHSTFTLPQLFRKSWHGQLIIHETLFVLESNNRRHCQEIPTVLLRLCPKSRKLVTSRRELVKVTLRWREISDLSIVFMSDIPNYWRSITEQEHTISILIRLKLRSLTVFSKDCTSDIPMVSLVIYSRNLTGRRKTRHPRHFIYVSG